MKTELRVTKLKKIKDVMILTQIPVISLYFIVFIHRIIPFELPK